jgi:hypothetical protein
MSQYGIQGVSIPGVGTVELDVRQSKAANDAFRAIAALVNEASGSNAQLVTPLGRKPPLAFVVYVQGDDAFGAYSCINRNSNEEVPDPSGESAIRE